MRGKLAKVTAQIAALKAARLAKVGPRIVAAELSAIGCRAKVWPNGEGLTVDTWDGTPELDAARKRKLAELEAKGISAFVVVIDRLEDRGATGNGSTPRRRGPPRRGGHHDPQAPGDRPRPLAAVRRVHGRTAVAARVGSLGRQPDGVHRYTRARKGGPRMARKGQEKAVATLRQKAGPRSGLVRAVLYVTPEQLAALHELAKVRAEEAGKLRPDVSEATRSVLAAWLEKR